MTAKALTIAGSDPSGGAGIQADLKTFAACEAYGLSVITSITAQNSKEVRAAHDLPPDTVAAQLRALFADGPPQAVKTGMLGNEHIVECVAAELRRARTRQLVVDPVIRSTSGKTLLTAAGVRALKERLLPQALLVTPNIPEAAALSGHSANTRAGRVAAARRILRLGVKAVLIKGGHDRSGASDLLHDGRRAIWLESPRLRDGAIHGTGCILSAAITAYLARGLGLEDAVRRAKELIAQAIVAAVVPGAGMACAEPLAGLYRCREKLDLQRRVAAAAEILRGRKIGNLIPEVQSNLAVALKNARTVDDVLGFPGRIVKKGLEVAIPYPAEFGGSRHIAKVALTAMRYDPEMRAVMNVKYDAAVLRACKRLRLETASFDRAGEPRDVKAREGSSLEWGTDKAIRDNGGKVPDVIFDLGGVGKEEMIRVIARDVEELLAKVLRLHRACSG